MKASRGARADIKIFTESLLKAFWSFTHTKLSDKLEYIPYRLHSCYFCCAFFHICLIAVVITYFYYMGNNGQDVEEGRESKGLFTPQL